MTLDNVLAFHLRLHGMLASSAARRSKKAASSLFPTRRQRSGQRLNPVRGRQRQRIQQAQDAPYDSGIFVDRPRGLIGFDGGGQILPVPTQDQPAQDQPLDIQRIVV